MSNQDIRTTNCIIVNNYGYQIPAGTPVAVLDKGLTFRVMSHEYGVFFCDVSELTIGGSHV